MEMETITTAIGTAITSLSTNIQTMNGTKLPALLGVAAIFIAIPAVWGLVMRFCRLSGSGVPSGWGRLRPPPFFSIGGVMYGSSESRGGRPLPNAGR